MRLSSSDPVRSRANKLFAVVQVSGVQAGVNFTLVAHNGTLRLTVVECGTYIDNLEIELEGGASWLYRL